ncbi:Noc3-like protein [Penicillium ucsense]|uniref:Nucleolar complex-associated protein 3 n=1 Tax=Penicillium ucsense TaxID=2839758 RepID=A0A8J8W2A7_9EURO|nr:Noc3-like protein [Penicillium ucsense]KAF7736306.1 Noc3-like protein [Penicillium ucsense]
MARGPSAKRRRLSPPADVKAAQNAELYSGADEWDAEQDYERRPRKSNKKENERTRLPIKTSEGFVHAAEVVEDAGEETDSFLGTDDDDEMEDGSGDEDSEEEEEIEKKPKIPVKVQILQAKEDLARIATSINEDPEENIALFKTMADMVDNEDSPVTVRKLALAAQAAVYKDVIPGYRIRPLSEEDMQGKHSKEVRKLRNFEQSLVSGYRNYVQKLATLSKAGRVNATTDPSLRSLAISCACTLLQAVPHFNFRTELLKILVNRLARKQVDGDFVKCRETMEEIFAKDNDGVVSLEAVRLLSKMMKAREFNINESVLNTFLHLRLLGEFSRKASRDRVDPNEPEEEKTLGKKQKQKREFRTKRERKVMKERKVVEKDMKVADALVSHEERDKNQAETLKLVFGIYFRILKQRIPNLMGPVLEGLAKYAHLINQDFFGDLLEAMKDLIGHAERDELGQVDEDVSEDEEDEEEDDESYKTEVTKRDARRETLLCTITAFALLEGQDASKAASTLHLDLSFFIKHLYRSLYALSVNPDVEYNPNTSLRLPDPNSAEEQAAAQLKANNKVNFQTPMVLLLRCLQSALLSRAHGTPPPVRLATFAKRLMTTSLQLPEKSAIATLSLMNQVSKHHARRISSLWHSDERKGDGVFNAYATDVEATNVYAGSVWEGELLRHHYCPQVRESIVDIEKMMTGTGTK